MDAIYFKRGLEKHGWIDTNNVKRDRKCGSYYNKYHI